MKDSLAIKATDILTNHFVSTLFLVNYQGLYKLECMRQWINWFLSSLLSLFPVAQEVV